MAIIDKNAWGETFNGVNPAHPSKEDYYTKRAADKNLPLPEFDKNTISKGKIVKTVKIGEKLDYSFKQGIS